MAPASAPRRAVRECRCLRHPVAETALDAARDDAREAVAELSEGLVAGAVVGIVGFVGALAIYGVAAGIA